MYVRGYLQGSENGRVVTIGRTHATNTFPSYSQLVPFRNRQSRDKNCLWRPCLLMDRDEICKFQREPSVDASDQVTVHLAKQFQRRRFFRNQPISNKNCLWRPCLTGRHEMSKLYRGRPSIDASYQVLVHLAKLFQRRRSSSSRYGVNSSTSRLKLQRMVGEQQKIARVCTIKMSLFTVKSSWYCSHVSDESRHRDGIFCM